MPRWAVLLSQNLHHTCLSPKNDYENIPIFSLRWQFSSVNSSLYLVIPLCPPVRQISPSPSNTQMQPQCWEKVKTYFACNGEGNRKMCLLGSFSAIPWILSSISRIISPLEKHFSIVVFGAALQPIFSSGESSNFLKTWTTGLLSRASSPGYTFPPR